MTTYSTLRPGVLVSLKTSLRGGIAYERKNLESDHLTDDGKRTAAWQTRRTIEDPQEHKAATEARGRARTVISAVCSYSSFGLLCPTDREAELTEAIAKAREIAREHNATARRSYLDVYVLVGRIAQDDVEAARAIRSEIRSLLDEMTAGIKAADPEQIRDAANKARQLDQMLSLEVSGKVTAAIKEARQAAREIVKRVQGSASTAAEVVKLIGTERIEAARFAVLDMDEGEATPAPIIGSSIDMESAEPVAMAAGPVSFDLF